MNKGARERERKRWRREPGLRRNLLVLSDILILSIPWWLLTAPRMNILMCEQTYKQAYKYLTGLKFQIFNAFIYICSPFSPKLN